MCGIVGYIGPRQATPVIYDGLKRLEYRGYDSAGIAVIGKGGSIAVRRETGKLSNLERKLNERPLEGHIGIGHTRWATHGSPTETNAHPHADCTGGLVVIHNGIVENFSTLRQELIAKGHVFASETDTEVIVHLVEQNMLDGQSFEEAARTALLKLKGAQAVVLMNRHHPDRVIASRIGNAGGVTVGVGHGEMFIASDLPAILEHTRQMVFLQSRQMAVVLCDGLKVVESTAASALNCPSTRSRMIRSARPRATIVISCKKRFTSRLAR